MSAPVRPMVAALAELPMMPGPTPPEHQAERARILGQAELTDADRARLAELEGPPERWDYAVRRVLAGGELGPEAEEVLRRMAAAMGVEL